MKEILLISDKGGTGKTTIMKLLVRIVGHNAVYADCTFTSTWKMFHNILSEDIFFLGQVAVVDDFACIGCGDCEKKCNFSAIRLFQGQAQIIKPNCVGCGFCLYICPTGAISLQPQIGGKIIQKEVNGAIIVYGTLQYFPRNGIRPVRIVRDKAVDVLISYKKKILICEAYPGWTRLTFSLVPFANILMPIVEPHPQVFEFLHKIKAYQTNYKSKIVLVINKGNLNQDITNTILQEFKEWDILSLSYSIAHQIENFNTFKSFILPILSNI